MKELPEILLWSDGAPQALGDDVIDCPAVTVLAPPPEQRNGCAVLICAGGGYRILASDHEGLQVGRWFNRLGITAFVLRYRLGEKYHSDISLLDGKRAMRFMRSQGQDLGLHTFGMLGFSAGGHLTAAVGTDFDDGDADHPDPVETFSCRPDFLVLAYAVTNGIIRGRKASEYTPTDVRVDADTPPAFIMHTHEDDTVPSEQALLFYSALARAGVQAELHVFGSGEHGLGLGDGDPDFNQWTDLLYRWLKRNGFLISDVRIEVSGRVTLDGQVMGACWVSLLPIDGQNTPYARTRVHRRSGGEFQIDAASGPLPGPHKVLVYHFTEQNPYSARGEYSLDDVEVYATSIVIAADEPLSINVTAADAVQPNNP
jgi:acetyl esterase/lipase